MASRILLRGASNKSSFFSHSRSGSSRIVYKTSTSFSRQFTDGDGLGGTKDSDKTDKISNPAQGENRSLNDLIVRHDEQITGLRREIDNDIKPDIRAMRHDIMDIKRDIGFMQRDLSMLLDISQRRLNFWSGMKQTSARSLITMFVGAVCSTICLTFGFESWFRSWKVDGNKRE